MEEKHLADIFSKAEVGQIVEHAIGREADEERELLQATVEFYDLEDPAVKIMGINVTQKIIVPIFMEPTHSTAMQQLQIWSNGYVKYVTFSGTDLGLLNPLPIYELIVSKKEELEEING